jgi:hypothetical protein
MTGIMSPGAKCAIVHEAGTTKECRITLAIRSSLRGANGSRECAPDDRLRDEAIHSFLLWRDGLLRFARNDVGSGLSHTGRAIECLTQLTPCGSRH